MAAVLRPDRSAIERGRRAPALAIAVLRGLALTAVALALLPPPLRAQYSPNCERNGRRDYCAFTPASRQDGLDAGQLVFADHQVYRLQREESSCRDQGAVRLCRAWILAAPGSPQPIPATYRGIAYEGGYQHTYRSARLSLSYSFLD